MNAPTAILIAVITALGGFGASLVAGKATAEVRVSEIDTKVQVLQERQGLQYTELKGVLDRIEKKVDAIPKK